MVYIILGLMIISNFNWLFKENERKNIISRKAYVKESYRIAKQTRESLQDSDGESKDFLVAVSFGISLLIACAEMIVALLITRYPLLIPFCIIMILCEVYENKYVFKLLKGEVTYTEDTLSHAVLIYRRLFYMNLTISVALAIF